MTEATKRMGPSSAKRPRKGRESGAGAFAKGFERFVKDYGFHIFESVSRLCLAMSMVIQRSVSTKMHAALKNLVQADTGHSSETNPTSQTHAAFALLLALPAGFVAMLEYCH